MSTTYGWREAWRSIGYVNVIRFYVFGWGHPDGSDEWYHLEYLVPLPSVSWNLHNATSLKARTRGWFGREVTNIEWVGGKLADILNGDASLKRSLLTELQLNRQLGINIVPEPAYACVRIVTTGVSEQRRRREAVLHLPSAGLFDGVDRIAGHVIEIAELAKKGTGTAR